MKWAARTSAKLLVFQGALNHFWPKPRGYPVKLIQVAGTSGKGSTCKFLQSALSEYGRAGCYVKPHVFDYAERFTVEGGQVGHEEILEVWNQEIKPYIVSNALNQGQWLLDHPETSLLMALKIFERHRLDWAAVETGIGGIYDPVTVLDVIAAVLTNVGRDHEDVLGSEHWQRALEKAQICRPGVPLILGDEDETTVEVVSSICREKGAPLLRVSAAEKKELQRAVLRVRNRGGESIMDGSSHQLQNAAVAVKTIKAVLPEATLERMVPRLLETRYIGRFWAIEAGVYADVAHNPSKTEALADEVRKRFPRQKKVFVIGISGTRNAVEVVRPLVPQARAFVVTAAGYKGQDPAVIGSMLRKAYPGLSIRLVAEPRGTLKVAKSLRKAGEPVVFTGSTYTVDQALNPDDRLRHLNGTYGWREAHR